MSERQKEYFRRKLLAWREGILAETRETMTVLQTESENNSDIADRASSETDHAMELRARDRQLKLIAKIESALKRIEDGSYGYCVETGDQISLRRLEARPIATLSSKRRSAMSGAKGSIATNGTGRDSAGLLRSLEEVAM